MCKLVYITFFLHFVLEMNAVELNMNKDIRDLLGSNNTVVECSFNATGLAAAKILAKNLTTNNYNAIAAFSVLERTDGILKSDGEYLRNRVTLSNISRSSTAVKIIFHELLCVDEREYICKVDYYRAGSLTIRNSSPISIIVIVPPSRPNNILLIKKTKETVNESLSTETITVVNDNATFPPKSEAMQNEEIISANTTLIEGNIVTFLCLGVVGNPPTKFLWQKLDPSGHLTYDYNASTSFQKIDGECYYNGTSEVTYTVTAEDNQAKMYCLVENMTELNSTTGPLEVYYKVRKPIITKHPDQHMYGKETTTLTLNCSANGNPPPSILWKKNDKILGDMSHYEITDLTTNKSGIYECVANNSFQNKVYTDFTSVNITVVDEIVTTTPAPTEKPTQSSSETVTSRIEKNQESTIYIIVAVVAVVAVVVIIGIGYMLWKRKEIPKNAKGSMRMTEDQYENKSFSDEANKTEKAVESNTPDTTADNNSSHKTVL